MVKNPTAPPEATGSRIQAAARAAERSVLIYLTGEPEVMSVSVGDAYPGIPIEEGVWTLRENTPCTGSVSLLLSGSLPEKRWKSVLFSSCGNGGVFAPCLAK